MSVQGWRTSKLLSEVFHLNTSEKVLRTSGRFNREHKEIWRKTGGCLSWFSSVYQSPLTWETSTAGGNVSGVILPADDVCAVRLTHLVKVSHPMWANNALPSINSRSKVQHSIIHPTTHAGEARTEATSTATASVSTRSCSCAQSHSICMPHFFLLKRVRSTSLIGYISSPTRQTKTFVLNRRSV